jgi:hypothetical protein
MIKSLLIFYFLSAAMFCFGQTPRLDKDTSNYKNSAVILLKTGDQQTSQASSFIVDNNYIDSVKIEDGADYVKTYGAKANVGVLIIYIKPGTQLLTTNQLLNKFGIAQNNLKLPVYTDYVITCHPEIAYYQLSMIKTVKTLQEKKTKTKYISIRTILPIKSLNTDVYQKATYTRPEKSN